MVSVPLSFEHHDVMRTGPLEFRVVTVGFSYALFAPLANLCFSTCVTDRAGVFGERKAMKWHSYSDHRVQSTGDEIQVKQFFILQ